MSTGQSVLSAADLLGVPGRAGVLMCASRDPDAKLTFVVSASAHAAAAEQLVVKVPVTEGAAKVVEDEARTLVRLRCLDLGALGPTIPRYVRSAVVGGRTSMISTSLPGRSMAVGYHSWRHTARRHLVREDLRLAAQWLATFQADTTSGVAPLTWPAQTAAALAERWAGHPRLEAAASRLTLAQEHMEGLRTPVTFVHGDFWFGNLLVRDGQISGCVDWEAASPQGCPLRDVARFMLSYALYLDRHGRPDHRVPGHRGLRRGQFGAGVSHVLTTDAWVGRDLRGFVGAALSRLGLPRSLWYDVALTGLAEVAVTANDDDFAGSHLGLLASLPCRPRGRSRS